MQHFNFSRKGKEWNEDRAYSCDNFAFVIDGASSLTKQKFSNFTTDAEWYSNWWYEFLKESLYDTTKSIMQVLEEGIKLVVRDYDILANGAIVEDFPSATISIARINGEMLETYVLCDSSIVLLSKNDETVLIQDMHNVVNDGINAIILKDFAMKENTTMIETRKKHGDVILEGRLRKNTPGAYHVLSDNVDAIGYGIYKTVKISLVDKVMLLTDGFSQVYDTIKMMTYEQLIKKVNNITDAEKIYAKLYKKQEKDKSCTKYLRFKIRDDAAIAFMKF